MKREHSAYFEYFVEPIPKTDDWAWRVVIYRLPASLGPAEKLAGRGKDQPSARKAAQEAAANAMEKHRIKKAGPAEPIVIPEEGA